MGLMHGPHKQGAQHETKQVNQAVLIIDAGNQYDQQQNAEHHTGAGGQNEDVFLAEQNAVCTGNTAVDPAAETTANRLFYHAHQAGRLLKSSMQFTDYETISTAFL